MDKISEDNFVNALAADELDVFTRRVVLAEYTPLSIVGVTHYNRYLYVKSVQHVMTTGSSYFRNHNLFVPKGTNMYYINYETLRCNLHTLLWSPDMDLSKYEMIIKTRSSEAHIEEYNRRMPSNWPFFVLKLEAYVGQTA